MQPTGCEGRGLYASIFRVASEQTRNPSMRIIEWIFGIRKKYSIFECCFPALIVGKTSGKPAQAVLFDQLVKIKDGQQDCEDDQQHHTAHRQDQDRLEHAHQRSNQRFDFALLILRSTIQHVIEAAR